jgi:alpha-1,2-mannosyltransferase
VARIPPAGRLVAASALFLLAVAGYALLVHTFPQYYWTQTDATVYRGAGIAVRHQPALLYSLRLGVVKDPYLYTPFAALLFAVPSGLSFGVWQVLLAVVTIGLLPIVAYASLGIAGRPASLERAAGAFAIAAVSLWLEPVAETLFFGQINVVLLALVICDFALPDRFKGKGIGIGLAAGIKLTPLIFIPYLLLTRRLRAGLVSIGTFAVTFVFGYAFLPQAAIAYWWGGKLVDSESNPFHLLNQSLYGALLRLTHDAQHEAHTYWLLAAVVVGVGGLATSIVASRRGYELLGVVLCGATSLLISPISFSHHYVYVVPVLALAAYGPRRLAYRIAGAAVVVGLFGWWPIPIGPTGGYHPGVQLLPRGLLRLAPNRGPTNLEFTWRGLELIAGNYYIVVSLLFIAVTACGLWVTRRRVTATEEPVPAPGAAYQARSPGTVSLWSHGHDDRQPLLRAGHEASACAEPGRAGRA